MLFKRRGNAICDGAESCWCKRCFRRLWWCFQVLINRRIVWRVAVEVKERLCEGDLLAMNEWDLSDRGLEEERMCGERKRNRGERKRVRVGGKGQGGQESERVVSLSTWLKGSMGQSHWVASSRVGSGQGNRAASPASHWPQARWRWQPPRQQQTQRGKRFSAWAPGRLGAWEPSRGYGRCSPQPLVQRNGTLEARCSGSRPGSCGPGPVIGPPVDAGRGQGDSTSTSGALALEQWTRTVGGCLDVQVPGQWGAGGA